VNGFRFHVGVQWPKAPSKLGLDVTVYFHPSNDIRQHRAQNRHSINTWGWFHVPYPAIQSLLVWLDSITQLTLEGRDHVSGFPSELGSKEHLVTLEIIRQRPKQSSILMHIHIKGKKGWAHLQQIKEEKKHEACDNLPINGATTAGRVTISRVKRTWSHQDNVATEPLEQTSKGQIFNSVSLGITRDSQSPQSLHTPPESCIGAFTLAHCLLAQVCWQNLICKVFFPLSLLTSAFAEEHCPSNSSIK
jgi:hypothetical protein